MNATVGRVDVDAAARRALMAEALGDDRFAAFLGDRLSVGRGDGTETVVQTDADGANREMAKARDFASAKRYVTLMARNGQLGEAALMSFAKQRKYEETVAALAELSRSGIDVIRPLMQSLRDDGILIPCRVANLSWETVSAVLDSRFTSGNMGPHELAQAKAQYAKLTLDNAQRMLRFWQVKATDAPAVN